MTATLHQIVGAIQTLKPSKWHWDIHHFAESLDISLEEANGFITCIEKGGTGNKKDGLWKFNPKAFSAKIDLTQNKDNLLNFHYTDLRNKCRQKICRFVCLGKIIVQNKHITVRVQTEIVKFVMGTHKTLTNHYPEWANFCQKTLV